MCQSTCCFACCQTGAPIRCWCQIEAPLRRCCLTVAPLGCWCQTGAPLRCWCQTGAPLRRCCLTVAPLGCWCQTGAPLGCCCLTGAPLRRCCLTVASLGCCCLTGAPLRCWCLTGAPLRCCCLTGAPLGCWCQIEAPLGCWCQTGAPLRCCSVKAPLQKAVAADQSSALGGHHFPWVRQMEDQSKAACGYLLLTQAWQMEEKGWAAACTRVAAEGMLHELVACIMVPASTAPSKPLLLRPLCSRSGLAPNASSSALTVAAHAEQQAPAE